MSTQLDTILGLYRQRISYYAPLQESMREVQRIYHDRAEIPLLDLDRNEKASVPNLLSQGVDQMAGRIASVIPQVTFSSIKPGVRIYDRKATTASRTVTGWWQGDRLPLKMKQRARHLLAYSMSPTVVRWDHEDNAPTWHVRHPLETFPSVDVDAGQVRPTDCIFAYRRSVSWLRSHGYEEHVNRLVNWNQDTLYGEASMLMLEYVDADETVLAALHYGTTDGMSEPGWEAGMQGVRAIELNRYRNSGEHCPVSIPSRISLDNRQGQFDNMIGIYYQQAKLMALEVIAVEKGVFPDTYLVSRPGEQGRFLDGPHDGRTGKVNVIAGGDIKEIQSQPGYMTPTLIDRLERNQRVTAGIPSEFGGESGSNIRTGRRGDAVLSAVIDYPVAEAQETFAYALEEENETAISLAKKWDGSAKRTIYVGTGNNRSPVTYTANDTFETDEHTVTYPATGSDINQLIVGLGQRVGLGTMSKFTAAVLDPYIDNPETEHDAIIAEGLEQALLAGIQQQAQSGQIPPLTLSKIMTLVKNDKMELAEAITKVTEDAASETAAQQSGEAEGTEPMTADAMSAGPSMQALAGGGQPPPAIGPANPSQGNLASLLATLHRPTSQAATGVA